MGIFTPYGVPPRVKDAIDVRTVNELLDLASDLGAPTRDAPESDLYDWTRQRILDWLYDPNWTEPTDDDVRRQDVETARAALAEHERRAEDARAYLEKLTGERSTRS